MADRISVNEIRKAFEWRQESAIDAGIEGAAEWTLSKRYCPGNPYRWTVYRDSRESSYLWGDRYYTAAELVAKFRGVQWAFDVVVMARKMEAK